jgi:hypothetical protein
MQKKKLIAGILGVLLAVTTVTPAFAKPLQFEVTKSQGVKCVATNTKDRAPNNWQIEVKTTTTSGYSNFNNKDVIGFKVKDVSGTADRSSYQTIRYNGAQTYTYGYTVVPAQKAGLRLNSQVDSTGYYSSIKFTGNWYS